MADGDVTVGPTVLLDGNGNAIITFTATQQLNDSIYVVTTSAGQLLVPVVAFVGGAPGNQVVGGTCVVTGSYARSQSII